MAGGASVWVVDWRDARKRALSEDSEQRTLGTAPASMSATRSWGRAASIAAATSRFAASKRLGWTSIDPIEAPTSSTKTVTLLVNPRCIDTGRERPTTSRVRAKSCSTMSQLKRSRCTIALARTSSVWVGQRNVAGTRWSRRRIRKRYSATITPPSGANHQS